MWYTVLVTNQLNEGKDPADVKVSSSLSQIKPLQASRSLRCTCKVVMIWFRMALTISWRRSLSCRNQPIDYLNEQE